MSFSRVSSGAVQDNIIRMPDADYLPEPGGLGKLFFSKMSSYGDSVAQVDALAGAKDTYASFLKRCIRTAIVMRSRGVKPKDLIAIASFNTLNNCVPFIAILFLGGKVTSFDPHLSQADTVYFLKLLRPKMIFVGPESTGLIKRSLQEAEVDCELVSFESSDRHSQFSDFLIESSEEADFAPVEVADLKDTAVIFFSSGTTGLAKAICAHHLGLLTQSYLMMDAGYDKSMMANFYSTYADTSIMCLTGSILCNGCRLVYPEYDLKMVWDLIEKFKITTMYLEPTDAITVLKLGRPKGINSSSLKDLTIGGGYVSKKQMKDLREALPGTNVALIYGMSEMTGYATMFQPKKAEDMKLLKEKPESSGRPVVGTTYKIVDPETEEALGPNQTGELRFKTEFQMNGYYNQDSSYAWDADGFYKTGDMAYYDDDHCFFIVDRVKHMIKYRGCPLFPAYLEGYLLSHPAVQRAVVIGIPDPEDMEHPMGIVTLRKGYESTTAKELELFVNQQVADWHKLRGGVRIVDNIPTTPTNKVKRREIKEMVIRGMI